MNGSYALQYELFSLAENFQILSHSFLKEVEYGTTVVW